MSTELNFPGDEKNKQKTSGDEKSDASPNVDISLPHTDRAEGPFEHSGEVAGWTKEEEIEKTEPEQQ